METGRSLIDCRKFEETGYRAHVLELDDPGYVVTPQRGNVGGAAQNKQDWITPSFRQVITARVGKDL
ncbi:MAG TPA: hypothetical protein VMR88_02870 [Candidatus Polarisedimenticolaceae bacterium]|nr:hypothetical protein [Candidatus Polarisedimenticolaceae bacterium]